MVIDLEHFASWRVQHPVLIGYHLQDGNSAKLLTGCSIVYQASHFWVLYHGIGPMDSMPMCPLVRLLGYKVVPGLDFIFKKLFHLTRDKEAILNRVCGSLVYAKVILCGSGVDTTRAAVSWLVRERSRFYLFMPPVQQSICFSAREDMNQRSHLLRPGLRCLFI